MARQLKVAIEELNGPSRLSEIRAFGRGAELIFRGSLTHGDGGIGRRISSAEIWSLKLDALNPKGPKDQLHAT